MGYPATHGRGWDVQIRRRSPWPDAIEDDDYRDLIEEVVRARAQDIKLRHAVGEYPRDSFAFVLLDPTASRRADPRDIILAIAWIGPEGGKYIANALAKVFEHWDSGDECGTLVYTQKHRLPGGSFRYGFSVCIDGTYDGGSGETELQDRYQCTVFAADFNHRVGTLIKEWEAKVGKGSWYNDLDQPDDRFQAIVDTVVSSITDCEDDEPTQSTSIITDRQDADPSMPPRASTDPNGSNYSLGDVGARSIPGAQGSGDHHGAVVPGGRPQPAEATQP
jgi:hypothetical protein